MIEKSRFFGYNKGNALYTTGAKIERSEMWFPLPETASLSLLFARPKSSLSPRTRDEWSTKQQTQTRLTNQTNKNESTPTTG